MHVVTIPYQQSPAKIQPVLSPATSPMVNLVNFIDRLRLFFLLNGALL